MAKQQGRTSCQAFAIYTYDDSGAATALACDRVGIAFRTAADFDTAGLRILPRGCCVSFVMLLHSILPAQYATVCHWLMASPWNAGQVTGSDVLRVLWAQAASSPQMSTTT